LIPAVISHRALRFRQAVDSSLGALHVIKLTLNMTQVKSVATIGGVEVVVKIMKTF
jgi:hypothetical protein